MKGRMLFYLLLLLFAIAAMLTLRNCRAGSTYDRNRRAGGDTINVAIEYSPMSLYKYGDTLGGFNYDLIREIAAGKGMKLKFHPLSTLALGLDGLAEGKYDIIVADVANTTQLENKVIFTEPTFLDRQVLVQLKDSITHKAPITQQLQLAGDTVYVPDDATLISRIHALGREIGDTIPVKVIPEYGAEQLFVLTAKGQLPRTVVNESMARRLQKSYPEVDASLGISFTQFQSWLLSPDKRELADRVSKAIKEYKQTPAYRQLLSRYHLTQPSK